MQYLRSNHQRLMVQAVAELHNPRALSLAAVLAALNLAINQFTIPVSGYLEISFDFLVSVATGFLCGPWVAALSGVAYAVFVVANDKSAMARLDATVSTFYVLLVGAVLMGLYMLVTGDVAVNFEGRCLAYASVYPTTSVVGLICLAQGVHRIGATRAAIINMLEPAVSMLVSVLVFGGEEVTAFSLVGCAMILASVVVVTVTKAEAGAAPLPQDSQGGGTSP